MSARDRFLELSKPEQQIWLKPAEDEFCAFGFEKASLNRILERAGMSKGRTYHYFADKGALFRATLDARLPKFDLSRQAAPLNAADAKAFWAEISALVVLITAALKEDEKFAKMIRVLHRESAAKLAFAEPLAQLRIYVGKLIDAGQSVGAVRNDLPTTLLTDVALELAITIDRWFATYGQTLSGEDERVLSQCALGLLIAPFLPPMQSQEGCL